MKKNPRPSSRDYEAAVRALMSSTVQTDSQRNTMIASAQVYAILALAASLREDSWAAEDPPEPPPVGWQ